MTVQSAWKSVPVRLIAFLAAFVAVVSVAYLGGLLGPSPASAAIITVTADADADPPDDHGQCSLREAIDNAYDDPLPHTDCEARTH